MGCSIKLLGQSLANLCGHYSSDTDTSLEEFKDEEDRVLSRDRLKV